MNTSIKLYDAIALMEAIPAENLLCGHVGYVIEEWAAGVFEVEFSDRRNGITFAMLPLRADQLLLLHFEPVER